jgi:hypothetical protein
MIRAHRHREDAFLGNGYWGGWIRTSDLLINSQALCQLSYTPKSFAPRPAGDVVV